MATLSKGQSWLSSLQPLTHQYPDLPIIVLVEPDTLPVRLEIVRHLKDCTCLPRTTPPQKIVDSFKSWHHHRSNAQLQVLAVDDDPLLLTAIEHPLMTAGIQVSTLSNPHEFWNTLCQIRPDLLLLDYEMPDINGLELCQIIRADQQWQRLPIIFLSGQANPDIVQAIYRAGADDYITKPVTESELLIRIMNRAALKRRFLG